MVQYLRFKQDISGGDGVAHRQQVDIGMVQAGVRVAADHHALTACALYRGSASQCIGLRRVSFHHFGIAGGKIRDGKTAVVGFAGPLAVDLVAAAVAVGGGGEGSGDLDAGEGRPLRTNPWPFRSSSSLDTLRTNTLSSITKASMLSGAAWLQDLPAAGSAEAKPGVIGKFCVLFRELSVAVASLTPAA